MPGDTLRGVPYSPRARLALVVDEPDSSQSNLARSIVPHLSARFDVEVLHLSDYDPARAWTPSAPSELFHELYCGAYDLVHTFTPTFGTRVFESAIAAEPALWEPEAVLERALKIPLTVSLPYGSSLDPSGDRCAALYADVAPAGGSEASWSGFFETVMEAVRAETGPLSDLAVWERVKAWKTLVEYVRATEAP